jgi:hypothetical protein
VSRKHVYSRASRGYRRHPNVAHQGHNRGLRPRHDSETVRSARTSASTGRLRAQSIRNWTTWCPAATSNSFSSPCLMRPAALPSIVTLYARNESGHARSRRSVIRPRSTGRTVSAVARMSGLSRLSESPRTNTLNSASPRRSRPESAGVLHLDQRGTVAGCRESARSHGEQ